jgi:hypothetical protein
MVWDEAHHQDIPHRLGLPHAAMLCDTVVARWHTIMLLTWFWIPTAVAGPCWCVLLPVATALGEPTAYAGTGAAEIPCCLGASLLQFSPAAMRWRARSASCRSSHPCTHGWGACLHGAVGLGCCQLRCYHAEQPLTLPAPGIVVQLLGQPSREGPRAVMVLQEGWLAECMCKDTCRHGS